MTRARFMSFLLLTALFLAVAVPSVALAQGFTMGTTYTFHTSMKTAIEKAAEKETGIVVLLLADGVDVYDHKVASKKLGDEDFATLANRVSYAKFETPRAPDGDDPDWLVEKRAAAGRDRIAAYEWFGMDRKTSAFIVADRFGNAMKTFALDDRFWEAFSSKLLDRELSKMNAFMKKQRKSAERALKKAKKAFDGEKWKSARKSIDKVHEWKGYPEVVEATELREKLIEAGRSKLAEALALEEDSEKRSALESLRRAFEETEVEAEVKQALDALDE